MRIPLMKQISWYLVFAIFMIGIVPKADSRLGPWEVIALSEVDRGADLDNIQKVIEANMIKDRLEQYGFSQDEVNSKLSKLSDRQLNNYALRLDDLRVGGDGSEVVAAILAIATLVVILVYLLHHKVVVS